MGSDWMIDERPQQLLPSYAERHVDIPSATAGNPLLQEYFSERTRAFLNGTKNFPSPVTRWSIQDKKGFYGFRLQKVVRCAASNPEILSRKAFHGLGTNACVHENVHFIARIRQRLRIPTKKKVA